MDSIQEGNFRILLLYEYRDRASRKESAAGDLLAGQFSSQFIRLTLLPDSISGLTICLSSSYKLTGTLSSDRTIQDKRNARPPQ